MRGKIDEWMESIIRMQYGKAGVDEYDDLHDWGLWYNTPAEIEYTRRCWELLHYYRRLPESGGLADQDANRMDDIMTLERVYQYHHHRLYVDGVIGED